MTSLGTNYTELKNVGHVFFQLLLIMTFKKRAIFDAIKANGQVF